MVSGLLSSYSSLISLGILITFIILLIRKGKKKKIEETPSVKLFFDIMGLLSTIPLGYYILSNGKFIFGSEPKDLLYPIAITIIFIIIHSFKEIASYIKSD